MVPRQKRSTSLNASSEPYIFVCNHQAPGSSRHLHTPTLSFEVFACNHFRLHEQRLKIPNVRLSYRYPSFLVFSGKKHTHTKKKERRLSWHHFPTSPAPSDTSRGTPGSWDHAQSPGARRTHLRPLLRSRSCVGRAWHRSCVGLVERRDRRVRRVK